MEPSSYPSVKKLATNFANQTFQSPEALSSARRNTAPPRMAVESPRTEPGQSPRSKEVEQAIQRSRDVMMANKDHIDVKARKRQLKDVISKLNDNSKERQVELSERLEEIRLLVWGKPQKPSKSSNSAVSVATAIVEIMRLAGTTAIIDCGNLQQNIREDANNKFAPVDVADMEKRFRRLFTLYKKYAGDDTSLPETTPLTPEDCQRWAEEMEAKDAFNVKMRRFIRSSSQSIFTGSLTKKDVLMGALNPNFSNICNSNKLHITIPAGYQMIYRHFIGSILRLKADCAL